MALLAALVMAVALLVPARALANDDLINLDNAVIHVASQVEYSPNEGDYPEVTVTYGDRTLEEYSDYFVEYEGFDQVGTATVTVTPCIDTVAVGSKTAEVQVITRDVNQHDYQLAAGWQFTYNGEPQEPYVFFTSDDPNLPCRFELGRDFTYTVSNNVNAGEATVTATMIGNCRGTLTTTFTIDPLDLNNEDVSFRLEGLDSQQAVYLKNGHHDRPTVVGTYKGQPLVEGRDYTVDWEAVDDESTIGARNFEVYGTGNFSGGKLLTFFIYPEGSMGPLFSKWNRCEGDTALGTMASIVTAGWCDDQTLQWDCCDSVVLATNNGYWDALAASGLAGALRCPILLTDPNSLSYQASDAIQSVDASKVYVLGGKSAISTNVESQLKDMGLEVERLGGLTAVETSRLIAAKTLELTSEDMRNAVVATVNGYYDALSIAPFAYSHAAPVYITQPNGLLSDAELEQLDGTNQVVIVGGKDAVSEEVDAKGGQLAKAHVANVKRIAGNDAWQTSQRIADWEIDEQGMTADKMAVADGNGYWDALAGAAMCGKNNAVLVLVPHTGTTSEGDYFYYNPWCIDHVVKPHAAEINRGYIFGGEAAVSYETEQTLDALTEGYALVQSGNDQMTLLLAHYVTDGYGKKAIQVWMTYRNLGSQHRSSAYAFKTVAYQHGRQLTHVVDPYGNDAGGSEAVWDGRGVTFCQDFELQGTSDVTIQVLDSNGKVLGQKVFAVE